MLKNQFLKIKNIKVYTPVSFESDTKGYWLDNDGKLYEDNIIIQSCNIQNLPRIKHILFSKGEKAVFYVQNGIAHIEDKAEGLTLLRECKRVTCYSNIIDKERIKKLCNKFGGCTVYKNKNRYKIEVWTK